MDTCEEILITITRNKTRSLLTAFGVFWGIFMLVALIGGGQGLEGMMKKNFEGFATNSGFLAAQKTGEAYKGFRKGRWWNLEAIDIERLRSQVKDVEVITPSIARWGSKAVYEDKKYDCSVKGLYPDYLHIESQEMAYGRFINEVDIQEARKVCVIGKRIYESLFKPGEDPCGKYIRVDGIYYQVIGMSSSEGDMNIQGRASEAVTLPFTTMQQTYNLGGRIDVICFTVKHGIKVSDVQPEMEQIIKAAHYIAPNDKQALMYLNAEAMFSMVDNLFTGINILVWMVGLGTLLAGAIGVSNIMMVTVKERTTEIGIRRAIGARPKDILQQILSESMVLVDMPSVLSGAMTQALPSCSMARALWTASLYRRARWVSPLAASGYLRQMRRESLSSRLLFRSAVTGFVRMTATRSQPISNAFSSGTGSARPPS